MARGRQRSGVTAAESSETNKATKRGRKPKDEDVETSSDSEEEAPPAKLQKKGKNNTKAVKGKPAAQAKANKPLQNKSSTDYSKIDWGCSKKSANGKPWNFKISSWNVDGIRAWWNKGGLEFINHEKPDILCLQETKCSEKKLPEDINIPEYSQYWASGVREGYAGVAIFSKKEPLKVEYGLSEDFDEEGRMITVEYESFFVVCTYVPNSGRGLVTLPKRLEWNKAFRDRMKELDAKKPVIICGDMNVSHLEIDLANPKTNKKNAGFTQEERDGMTEFLGDGFVDTFRKFYPEETGRYTFWTYMSNCRVKNVGWRLDYGIVSERLMPSVCDNIIRSDVFGSDHCPITLFLNLDGK
ncbi:recombination repair protein 1 isoform X2 [Arctopsyche grandis]|uniref:recombination repair protein 1 isoform X2 n=1 Tax=Arctopsyche grandis TaxID=121162 RepID=UPI00406D6B56